jgi:hypothetical protein
VPEKFAIVAIAHDQPVIRVIERKPFGDGFDRVGQPTLDLPQGDLCVLPGADVGPGTDHFDWLTVLIMDEVPVVRNPAVAAVLLAKSVLDSMATLLG